MFSRSVDDSKLQVPTQQTDGPHRLEKDRKRRLSSTVLIFHPVRQDVNPSAIRTIGRKIDALGQKRLFPPGEKRGDGFDDKSEHFIAQLLADGKGFNAAAEQRKIQRSRRRTYRFDILVRDHLVFSGFGSKLRLLARQIQHSVIQKSMTAGKRVAHPLGQKTLLSPGKIRPDGLFDVQKRLVDTLSVCRAGFRAPILSNEVNGIQYPFFHRHHACVVENSFLDTAGDKFCSVTVDKKLSCGPKRPLDIGLVERLLQSGILLSNPFAAKRAKHGPIHNFILTIYTYHS